MVYISKEAKSWVIGQATTHHPVQRACFREDLVDSGLDRVFFRHVCLDSEDLAGVFV